MCAANQRGSRCWRKTSARYGETGPTPPYVSRPTQKARLFRVQILRSAKTVLPPRTTLLTDKQTQHSLRHRPVDRSTVPAVFYGPEAPRSPASSAERQVLAAVGPVFDHAGSHVPFASCVGPPECAKPDRSAGSVRP